MQAITGSSERIKRIKVRLLRYWKVSYNAVYWTVMHDGIEHAGYLAFLALLSFFPFLVFFVAVAGQFGQTRFGDEFVHAIVMDYLPQHIWAALEPRIEEIISGPPQGLLTIAIIGVIWTASSSVEGTRTILNRAYRVHTPPAYIWRRLLSIVQFLVLIFIIFIGMTIMVTSPLIWQAVHQLFPQQAEEIRTLWRYVSYVLSPLLLFIVVCVSYYILPNIRQRWIYVVPGAFWTVVGWVGFARLFTSFLTNFEQVNLVYGSLGGIIASLLFFYVLGIIYIFGAEFNYFYEKSLGRRLVPREKRKKAKLKDR